MTVMELFIVWAAYRISLVNSTHPDDATLVDPLRFAMRVKSIRLVLHPIKWDGNDGGIAVNSPSWQSVSTVGTISSSHYTLYHTNPSGGLLGFVHCRIRAGHLKQKGQRRLSLSSRCSA